VVAHYGDSAPTLRLAAALRAATVVPARIVLVDNQGDLAIATDGLLEVVHPGHNSGFGAAVALGAEAALAGGADWVWLLNNDAEPAADCLERLLEAGAAPAAGIVGPVIRYRDDGGCWYAGGTVSPRTLSVRHETTPHDARPYATGFVTGCAPLLRADLARRLWPLDDGLFMYYEDVDWSLRAVRDGWRLLVAPEALVVHDVPREGGRRVFSDAAVYYMTRNRLLVARRHGGLVLPALAGTGWAARQALKSPSWPVARRRVRAWAGGLRDGVAGRRGPAPRRVSGGTA
jgi:GT2 family glycosyltransferase